MNERAFITLFGSMTVFEACAHIRRVGEDKKSIYTAFVTDGEGKLIGYVELRHLIFSAPDEKIEKIMSSPAPSVTEGYDKESAAELIAELELYALPVVDTDGRPIGIITPDDALDALEDAASEDISMLAAVTPSEKPYLESPVRAVFFSRIPWLLLLMLSASVTSLIIGAFESALSKLVILSAFIPMLMGTGGNSGAQSSVTVTRALSLGELGFSDIFRVLKKEICVALFCGGTLAIANFIKMTLFDMLIFGAEGVTLALSLTVSLTLFISSIFALWSS